MPRLFAIRNKMNCINLTAAAVLTLLAAMHAEAALPPKVQQLLTRYKIPTEAVSLMVQAVDEDTPRLALNIDTPRNPASTIKLVTTWVALDKLGPTHTWPTQVYAIGALNNGVLKGDLLIKGYGDPYFTVEDFWAMLGQLRRQGVREIQGDLLIDDSYFVVDETDPGAFDGQDYRLYNVLPSALLVNFKSIEFIVRPNAARSAIEIMTVPELPNLEIVNKIKLTRAACGGNAVQIYMNVPDPALPEKVAFSGSLPASCGPIHLPRSVMRAPAYTYGVFKSLWQQWGGTISGSYKVAAKPPKARLLVTWHSRELGEMIRPLNKWSNNVMTRMLLYAIGEKPNRTPITRDEGGNALLEHLRKRELDPAGLIIDNGSGLSRITQVSVRFMVAMMRHAWRQPTMPEFLASLSIVGKDGTTRKRFRGGPEAGRMHLKTGSINKVSAVDGYVHAPSGRTFVVSLKINHPHANWGAGTAIGDALLAWTFRQ